MRSSDSSRCWLCMLCPCRMKNEFLITFRVRVRVTLQLTVSQSVCLGVEPNLGLLTRDFFFETVPFFYVTLYMLGHICRPLLTVCILFNSSVKKEKWRCSRLRGSWDSSIWSQNPQNSNPRVTVLATTRNSIRASLSVSRGHWDAC
jgi:hypothetical protein